MTDAGTFKRTDKTTSVCLGNIPFWKWHVAAVIDCKQYQLRIPVNSQKSFSYFLIDKFVKCQKQTDRAVLPITYKAVVTVITPRNVPQNILHSTVNQPFLRLFGFYPKKELKSICLLNVVDCTLVNWHMNEKKANSIFPLGIILHKKQDTNKTSKYTRVLMAEQSS